MVPKARILASVVAITVGLALFLSSMYPAVWAAIAQAKPGVFGESGRVDKFSISGESAIARWSTADDEEHSFSEIFISLVSRAAKGDDHITESFIDVAIYQYELVEECEQYGDEEECYYDYDYSLAFFGFAELDKSDFKISNNLQSASVQDVEITGFDYFLGEELTITVDATWTGEGPVTKIKDSFTVSDEFFKYTFKFSGDSRDASATATVTGDIELGMGDAAYSEASLERVKEGTMIRFIGNPNPNDPPTSPGGFHGWKSLIAPIEELQETAEELEEQIAILEERVSELEERIDDGGPSQQDVVVETDDTEYNVGDEVEIFGNVADAEEGDEAEITIHEAGGGSVADEAEVDEDGDFSLTYEIPNAAEDGVYSVEVEFESDGPAFTYFLVDEEDDLVDIGTDDEFYDAGDTVEIFGEVFDPISGVDEISILVVDPRGEVIVDEEIELDDVEFEFEIDLDNDAPAGRYAVTAIYDGEEAGWAIFEVDSSVPPSNEIIAQLEDSTLSPGDEVLLTGAIDETDVEPGEEIVLEVLDPNDDVIFEDAVVPDDDGFFSFEFDLEDDAESGTYDLTLRYEGYEDKSLTFTVSG